MSSTTTGVRRDIGTGGRKLPAIATASTIMSGVSEDGLGVATSPA